MVLKSYISPVTLVLIAEKIELFAGFVYVQLLVNNYKVQ